jgi:hypothetical protein
VPIVLKSGILKLLEPSGLVQAYNGIALPLLLFSPVTVIRPMVHTKHMPTTEAVFFSSSDGIIN